MTQEELDALMAGGDLDSVETSKASNKADGHEHKHQDGSHVVKQLSDVTKESEVKATQIFDNLDIVLEKLDNIQNGSLESNSGIDEIRNIIFDTMSIMQYQDIHRQKIERVIHTMRDIYKLMGNTLEELDVDIAPAAKHISGDDDTKDLLDDDELERLIAQANS